MGFWGGRKMASSHLLSRSVCLLMVDVVQYVMVEEEHQKTPII